MALDPKVYPCVFIGLGSTGLYIIEELRRLFNEEFGVGGLPCFRYLVFETDNGKTADDSFLSHEASDFERIHLVPITIPNIDAIHRSTDLNEWLDSRLITRGDRAFVNGAGAMRQAGRLCLWENWSKVRGAIQQAVDAVRLADSLSATDRYLREVYLPRKTAAIELPRQSLADFNPRVYLCGTLCGGTCSGAFIDLAYHLWRMFAARSYDGFIRGANTEVIGLFTVPDRRALGQEANRQKVANAWAALCELDYYYTDQTFYRVRLPGDDRIETRDSPFDTLYLVSMMNQSQQGFPADDQGERSLAFMCAMNLFTEVAAGMAATKSKMRTDYRGAADYGKRSADGHMKVFSSFGLSGIWYPRYRIATGINRRLGEEMVQQWMGRTEALNPTNVDEQAAQFWHSIKAQAHAALLGEGTDAPYSPGVPTVIRQATADALPRFRVTDVAGLQRFMDAFPADSGPLAVLLGAGGQYHARIANCRAIVADRCRAALEVAVADYLRDHTVAEATRFVAKLGEHASRELAQPSGDIPVFSPGLDVGLGGDVEGDLATRMLRRRKAALIEYKEAVWKRFEQRAVDHVKLLGTFYLRWVVGQLQECLFRLRNRLNEAEGTLGALAARCRKEKEDQLQLTRHENVVTVFAGGKQDIADDIQLGAENILLDLPAAKLRELFLSEAGQALPADPLQLLSTGIGKLTERMDRRFDPHSQAAVTSFKLGTMVLGHFQFAQAGLVRSCAPYFECSPGYLPMTLNRTPNRLFAQEQDAAAALAREASRYLPASFEGEPMPLDHFVFFYQGQTGIAISDLAIGTHASHILQEAETTRTEDPTRFTHKDGAAAFDARQVAEFDAACEAIQDALALAQDKFPRRGERNDKQCLEYESATGQSRTLLLDDYDALRRFVRDAGYRRLEQAVDAIVRKVGRPEVIQRMERNKEGVPTDKLAELERRYDRLLSRVFPAETGA